MTKISKEDFEAWRDNPVTQEYFRQLQNIISDAKEQCSQSLWHSEGLWRNGEAKDLRIACRSRAECAEDMLNVNLAEDEDE